MANKRIGIMNIRQILQLKIRGESNRSIAELLGKNRNTINDYVRLLNATGHSLEELSGFDDQSLDALFPGVTTTEKVRYETLSSYFPYFRKELKKVGCTRLSLWEEYLSRHPDGYRSSQFNEHLNRWLKKVEGSGKLVHKAGDKLYVDYTGKHLSYVDAETGERIEVEVFVAMLPCSGYTFVEASPSQKREDFIDSMNNCLRFMGGVPKSIVVDNLKSAVTKGSKYEPILNKTFSDFALHYSCSINPTRTYAPQDKALVESAVSLVYQRIFYPLSKHTFFSLAELNQAIAELLVEYNDKKFSQINISRRQQFVDIEKDALIELPSTPYDLRNYKLVTAQKIGHVYLSADKHYYSIPHRFIGKKVELQYNTKSVEIFYKKERIASHIRDKRPGRYTTVKDHMKSTHKFYNDWSPEFFQSWARKYGEDVESYIKGLINQAKYPEVAYKQCMGVLQLVKDYPVERLQGAVVRAREYPRFSYNIVRDILKNNVDLQQNLFDTTPPVIPDHCNIRGNEYYN